MAPELMPSGIKVPDGIDVLGNLDIHSTSRQSPLSPDGSSSIISNSYSSEGTINNHKPPRVSSIRLRNAPSITKSSIMSRTATLSPPPLTDGSTERLSAAIDPLSHHILKRTNTENAMAHKIRPMERSESAHGDTLSRDAHRDDSGIANNADHTRSDQVIPKDKKKSSSFLSRFSMPSTRRKENDDGDDDDDEDDTEQGHLRPEGMNAHVFSTVPQANGYIPQHLEPPRYIKVRKHHKKQKEFNRTFLAQELHGSKLSTHSANDKVPGLTSSDYAGDAKQTTNNAIWATEFSKDGKYLAAAGADGIVRVWAVLSSKEDREAHEDEEDARQGYAERLSAPVFASKPIREYEGHAATVLDLSWSKNNFLLSSSMDKTVKLWHVSRQECLCTFKHKDFVTSIAFHPKDDRFFLAGSLDAVLRLWSIPDKSVAYFSQAPDLITAVAFSPDGKTAIAGVLSGQCLFYDSDELKFQAQMHVRSSRGKNAKGSKITGIRCCIYPHNDLNGETKVLITTNDSRIRMYNLADKTLELKFRGHENSCSQIRASISDDTAYVICGSENRKAYMWSLGADKESIDKEKRPVEMFEAHSDMVTTTAIAPLQTRQLLSQSGDPIYDLCNPPPVTLLSRAESTASSRVPTLYEYADKRSSVADTLSVTESISRHPQESAGYVLRCRHEDGNIIVTADHSGQIKVFRQDCAYQKRRSDMESSSVFSKKKNGLGRSGFIASSARKQSGTHSRRGSVLRRESYLNDDGERIMSWQNGVDGDTSLPPSIRGDRSISPSKLRRHTLMSQSHQQQQNQLQQHDRHNISQVVHQTPSSPASINRSFSTTSRNSESSRLSRVSFAETPNETPPRKPPIPERAQSSNTTPRAAKKELQEQKQSIPIPGFQLLRNTDTTPIQTESSSGKSWYRWTSNSDRAKRDKEDSRGPEVVGRKGSIASPESGG